MRKVLYIFGQLKDDDIEWLARAGSTRALKAGSDVIKRGSDAGRLFIVLEGKLLVTDAQGTRLAEVGVGEVVGEMSFVEARPPSADVRAASDVLLFEIPREVLRAKLDADTSFAARFYKALVLFLSDRLRAASAKSAGAEPDDGELDPEILDNLSQAGRRFDRLVEGVHRRAVST